MALFQNSVLKRHLKGLDDDLMAKKYETFSQYFLHPTIQENIRASKEEQFQATFLNELFVKILGYTLKPSLNYNLTTEYKNVKDAKKADGAILQDEKAIAVIELKGTNTTSLDKVESQAFGYKNNQPDAVYIVTSNFEKLRFYIDNAVDYEEFNLFHLSFERFKTLWLCLAKDNIFTGLPKRVKDTSLKEEENITKHLYKDYSAFRNDIFNSVAELNPEFDKLILFKKTQKLLDRFLFIFFAEDGGLLPPNSIKVIIDQWIQLRELDAYSPLYSRFKKYFGYMDTGHKGKKHDIFAYNGGLFKPDEILDNIKIDDDLLYKHTQKLSAYDFKSEVDVNILGHIFEHSLNEIEEMTAEIEGTIIEKSKTKRKKDGVFYTPKYITKYIVENTVGKLCEDKKNEIGIDEAEYNKSRKGRKKATLIKLKDQLEAYRTWLLGLTICDPACGSGAFLNQALSFLIEEHTYIDELQTKLLGGGFIFPNVENAILENNLYGVDINNESVDIAKLSLWLRSAKPKRKLTSLNNNIKCGNSLIDAETVAGDKAFNWEKEFPTVFANGGFDVVIGNPPYVQIKKAKIISNNLSKKQYFTFEKMGDLYCLFYELGIQILKKEGLLGYITSNKWMRAKYGKSLRKYLLENSSPKILIDLGAGVFTSATVDSNILITQKEITDSYELVTCKFMNEQAFYSFGKTLNSRNKTTSLNDNPWIIIEEKERNLRKKIESIGVPLKNWEVNFYRGIQTGNNDVFIINKELRDRLIKEDIKASELIKPVIAGKDISRYGIEFRDTFLIYTNDEIEIKNYFSIYSYLEENKEKLENKLEVKQGKMLWYSLYRPAKKHISEFDKEKLIFSKASKEQAFFLDKKIKALTLNTSYIATGHAVNFLVAILNSKFAKYIFLKFYQSGGIIGEITIQAIQNIPIPFPNEDISLSLKENANQITILSKKKKTKKIRFFSRVSDNLNISDAAKRFNKFYDHDFKTFLSELKKKKVKLKLSEQDEWEDYFNDYKTEINQLQAEINKTDKEIDRMVYELYGLTDDEIKIVEGA
jgi:type I restriction-modification system DNA methylase subunit